MDEVLREAVECKDLTALQTRLRTASVADVNRHEADGVTPLHVAAHHCNAEFARALCKAGAVVDSLMDGNITPLHFAAHYGDAECVRVLLEAGASLAPVSNGASPLWIAARYGNAGCVSALLEAGTAMNQAASDGITPLCAASTHGHAECVRVLCEAGAVVNQAADAGATSLHMAAHQGHANCIRALLKAGATVDEVMDHGTTPLHAAAQQGHTECIRELCEAGASVNQASQTSFTPLCVAARDGRAESSQVLSSYGARCALAPEAAAYQGHADLATWLRDAKAWTPLHHLEVLTPARALSLLRDGADLHAGSPSPLERARTVPGEVSALVVHAGRQWSPQTHHLFPAAARSYAVEVLRLGYLLAWSPRYTGEASSLVDVWLGYVLPHAVERI